MRRILFLAVAAALLSPFSATAQNKNPVVVIDTNYGTIKVELYPKQAPITVKNFLDYVEAKHYDGTIFHRVIADFMIQGGGFTEDMKQKPTKAPIKNESFNGLENKVGTIAMARTNAPDSATAQFFINVKDNPFLNKAGDKVGYAVFGKVIEGMDVVNKIRGVATGAMDVPQQPVIIKSIRKIQ